MNLCSDFWNALAQFHAEIEHSYFDLASVRRLLSEVESPVLIVGAGQGLIVEELRKAGYECDGVDLSQEMIRQAKVRRGITLVEADAKAMPFPTASYATIIYATGVIDFTAEEDEIRIMLTEGRRVVKESGKIFVAFYRASAVQEEFLKMVGLLSDAKLAFRQGLEVYMLTLAQVIGWVAGRASLSRLRATLALLRVAMFCTMQERRNALTMHHVILKSADAHTLINTAPETLPYRNMSEIKNLFKRLRLPVEQLSEFASCYVVRV